MDERDIRLKMESQLAELKKLWNRLKRIEHQDSEGEEEPDLIGQGLEILRKRVAKKIYVTGVRRKQKEADKQAAKRQKFPKVISTD